MLRGLRQFRGVRPSGKCKLTVQVRRLVYVAVSACKGLKGETLNLKPYTLAYQGRKGDTITITSYADLCSVEYE